MPEHNRIQQLFQIFLDNEKDVAPAQAERYVLFNFAFMNVFASRFSSLTPR